MYEERYNRDIVDYCLAGDIGYTKIEIICAEREVLLALDYRLSYPNPMNFLSCISKADEYDIQTHNIVKCLMVFTILDHRLVNYRSSQIAAATAYLARIILGRSEWVWTSPSNLNTLTFHIQDAAFIYYSGYTKNDIGPIFELMVDYLARPVAFSDEAFASKEFLRSKAISVLYYNTTIN